MSHTTAAQRILSQRPTGEAGMLPDRYWELVERYRGELVNQALSLVGDLADAEDVVQETFCEALSHEERLVQARSLGAWLRRMNRANALDFLRRRKSAAQTARDVRPRAATTGGFSLLETREAVARAIEALPPPLRGVVVLRFWKQLSCDEIAERLNEPAGTVRWKLCEAAKLLFGKLKDFLEPSAKPVPPPEARE
ncbi:MAG: sigma-70 family RNA polymerase sigma factor [Planctomycetota bacterium]|nr:sigma-70 family RNA polymerase sigma factor [Planctomycetota bacterium]